jgi:hypothetical protein
LILNKIIYLIPFLCARLTNCNVFEQVFVYDCPLSSKYNCNCPAKLQVSWGPKQVVMQKANMHTAESHAVDNRKFLKHQQRNTVAVALKASLLSMPVEVRRHFKNSSPQKQIDTQRLTSVRRAVRTERTNMTSISFPLCPVPVTGSLGSLTSLWKSMFLPNLIRRHNDPANDFHLDFHKVVCIAFKTDGGTLVCNTPVYNF